jgi:hypothetical protein
MSYFDEKRRWARMWNAKGSPSGARLFHIELILRYRRASLKDERNTYPANSRPTVPNIFRATLRVVIRLPLPIWHFTFDAAAGEGVGL